MTKREMFETIATLLSGNEEVVEFCGREIELLDKRKSSKRGMTATQKANIEVKEVIKAILAEVEAPLTVTELLSYEALKGFTNQKISALLRQLVAESVVVKTIEGKKAKFALA